MDTIRKLLTVLPFSMFLAAANLSAQALVNDNWSNAALLPSTSTCLIDTATAEPLEPAHDPQIQPSHSLWWTYTPTVDTFLTVETRGSDFDTLLAIYTGNSLDSLVQLARNDDDPILGNGWSRIRLKAAPGTTYYLVVDSVAPEATGSLTLTTEQHVLLAGEYASNDLFSTPHVLSNTVTSGSVMVVGNPYFYATDEISEPAHGGRVASHSLWWSYTATTNGVISLDTAGSTCHPLYAVYQGDSLDALVPVAGVRGVNTMTFPVDTSATYRIVVDGETETGDLRFNWQLNAGPIPENDRFAGATELIGVSGTMTGISTVFASSESGEPAHNGTNAVRSLWWVVTPVTDGTLLLNTAGCAFPAATAVCIGQTLQSLQPVQKKVVGEVSHYPLMSGGTYFIAVDGQASDFFGGVNIDWEILPPSPPFNDNFSTASVIVTATGSADADTATATAESGEPAHYGGAPRHTLWWSIMPLTNGTLVVDTEGSAFDTVLALYMGSSLATLQKLASNDSAGDDVMHSRIELLLAGGTTYHIALDGYFESDSGAARLNWVFTPLATNSYIVTLMAPQVIGYPSNIVVTAGALYGVLPQPSVYGYAFNGWWSGMGGAGAQVTNATRVTQSANHVLYAKLTPKTCRVTFDANGSTATQQVAVVTFGMAWPAITTPTRDGYVFNGWYTLVSEPVDLGSPVALESDQSVFAEWVAIPLPPPDNDNFAAASVIATVAGSTNVTTVMASAEPGEPSHYNGMPSHSVWWSFTPTQNGTLVVDTEGSAFDTVLALYTGSSLATLQKPASNDSAGDAVLHSRIEWLLAGGTTYHIALDGYSESDSGAARLNWVFTPLAANSYIVTLTAPQVIGYPSNIVVTAGAPYGVLPQPSVYGYAFNGWWSGMGGTGTQVTNATRVTQSANHVLYAKLTPKTCRVTFDANGATATQQVAVVTFGMAWPAITTPTRDGYLFDGWYTVEGEPIDLGSLVVLESDLSVFAEWVAIPLPPPDNDNFAAASVIATVAGSTNVTTVMASAESEEPAHYNGMARHTVWWSFTPTQNGTLVVDTEGSAFDTVLALYTGSSLTNLQKLASNDSAGDDVLHSRIEWLLVGGTTYHIALDGYSESDSGEACLNWVFTPLAANSYIVTLTAPQAIGYPSNIVVTTGAPYGVLPQPSVYGYTFNGWWSGVGGAGAQVTNATRVTQSANHALYAKLTPKTCRVTFDANGSTATQQVAEVTFGAPWPAITSPTLAGYFFDGWFTQEGLQVDLGSPVAFESDHTLFAWWVANLMGEITPTVTNWPTASAIMLGQTLAASTLSGGAGSVAGAFAFTAPGTVPTETALQGVTFTPTDVYNYTSVTGSVSVTVFMPPTVTAQPLSAVMTMGQKASLSVSNSGMEPFGYQWIKDGVILIGQTNSTLSFSSFKFTDSGSYSVVITNTLGMAISMPANLSVPNTPLRGWGRNDYGQLGNGMAAKTNLPITVASNVVATTGGGFHSLFVKSDGTLWAMGYNNNGQLGIGTTANTNRPVQVASNVVTMASGNWHSLFVKADGTLWAMGQNSSGQLGNGSTNNASLPVQVASNVVATAGGTYHSLFVKADGTLWAMGQNSIGQLGNGMTANTNLPVQVASNVVATAGGFYHSLFVKTDGTLWAMGQNSDGQLGIGTTSRTSLPVLVTSNVVASAGGLYHSLFVKADGTLWAMGQNNDGQLGNGTTAPTNRPVQVASNVVATAGGAYHSLFVKADGTLWAMGRNSSGQLGNGTTNNANLPVQVSGGLLTAGLAKEPTAYHSLAIAGAVPAVTLSNLTVTFGQTTHFTASVTDGDGPFTYQWQKNGTNILDATNGSYTVSSASMSNAGNYAVVVVGACGSTTSADATLTVNKANQTIIFPVISAKVTTDTVGLSATVPSGLPVLFRVLSGAASISGETNLTFSGAGSVSIAASQAGDSNYNAAPDATNTFSVTKAVASVSLSNMIQTYDGTAKRVTVTTLPSDRTVNVTYNSSATVPTNAGSYAVVATVNEIMYQGWAAGTLTIEKASQTVSFPGIGVQFTSNTVRLVATASSGLPVSFSVLSGSALISDGTNLTFSGVGSVSIVASQEGDANWNAAPHATNTFNVTASVFNHAPVGTANTVTLLEDTTYAFGLADFGFTDPNDSPANNFAAVKITTLPVVGTLSTGGSAVTNGQRITTSSAGETWTAQDTGRDWQSVASSTDGTKLVAAEKGGQLYTSTDSGANWTARATNRNWASVASSSDGTKLVAAEEGGQLYTSTDSGASWTARGNSRTWRNVASSTDGMKLIAVASGGQIYTSTDAGRNWTARASALDWTPVASSADGTKLVAAVWSGQIYTSTDSGVTWTAREIARKWRFVASSSNGSKLVAVVETSGQIYTSTDAGTNWTARAVARNWRSVASSSDGTRLVASVYGGQLYTSTNGGTNWTARASSRNWSSVASSSDGSKLVASVYGGQIYTAQSSLDLTFTPAANAYGSPCSSFMFQVQDDGGTANGGVDLDPTPKTMTLHVTAVPDDQTISFSTIENKRTTDLVGLSAAASSGLQVSFSVLSGSALISGGTNLTFSGAGIVKIVASQAGDANWNAAPTVTNTFTVSKATPSVITWPTASDLMLGQTLAASVLSGGAGSVAGAFAFTTPDIVPAVGTASQDVTFTPIDMNRYSNVTGLVNVTVMIAPPNITAQPISAVVTIGQTVSLNVGNSGTQPFGYQWIKDGVILSGQTNSTLSLSSFKFTDSGSYSVVITNTIGMAISVPANLSVPNAPLWAMGMNGSGQLGNGTTADKNLPVQVSSNVVAVAAGGEHSLFVNADGTLWAMGGNSNGQLGNGQPGWSADLPVLVASNVVAAAGGSCHSLFVKADGTLWAMGLNNYGQLGIDMPGWSTDLPVQVASNVVAVAAGYYHSLFVKADGTLWTMGWNSNGRLGNGTTVDARLPVQVASNVVTVASGNDHSLFVKADGTLWGMGDNSLGQLGVDVAADTTRPALVMSNVVSAAAGYAHTLFIKADGTLWGMGNNQEGELGLSRAADTTRPVLVTNHVVAAAGGTYHSLFVKADGTLWGMGNNSSGQLGDGTWETTNQPVLVNNGGLIAVSVARGSSAYHSLAIAGTMPVVSVSNLTVTVGQTTNFTAIVTGDGLFTYQWQFNGTNIVDATNDCYTISSATVSDAGDYVVLVTGTFGTAASAIATLTVNKMSQTVNFPNIGDQLTTNIVALSATATSGLSVTNFSVVIGPAVISAGSVSFTNSGSVTLSAVQDGDSNYNAAPAVTISFMVLASSYTLTVTSAHGGSDPAGTHAYNTPVSVMITNSPVFGEAVQYVCTGWKGTGSVPAIGATTSTGLFAMTQESTLVWLWTTNYLLKVETMGNGSVSTSNVWLTCGTPFQVSATPELYYHFTGWSGNAGGDTSNPLTLVMNGARSVTANFVPNLTANTSTPEYWLAQYGLTNFHADDLADADLDGMKTWQEYIAGTDPTNAASKFQITQTQMGGAVGTNFVIRWSSVAGKVYAVDATTNLLEGFPLNRGRDILATPDENVMTIRVDRASQEFFRIRVQP